MEKLLMFGLPEQAALEKIAGKLHLRTAEVPPEQFDQCVGTLAGYTTTHPAEVPAASQMPREGMLVLCGFSNSRLDRLLRALREAGLHIPYKAVLTASNANWTGFQLVHELMREHDAVQGT